jgi:hypothetical protein
MTAPRKTRSQKSRPALKLTSVSRISMFGPAPILYGEDGAAYDELLAQVSSAVKPTDAIENIWVRDIVDLTWEVLRWRRIKTSVIALEMRDALHKRLVPLLHEPDSEGEQENEVGIELNFAALSRVPPP